MRLLQTPRARLLAALGLLLLLAVLVPGEGVRAVAAARWLLGGALLVGLGLWLRRARPGAARREGPGVEVYARVGLSSRCAVALVQAAGQQFLIAHGDGFARIHPMSQEPLRQGRRSPRSGRPRRMRVMRGGTA